MTLSSTLFCFLVLCTCAFLVESRPSYYYSNKDSNGYHPPYDFYAAEASNTGSDCSPICNTLTETSTRNPNYTLTSVGRCTILPDFIANSNINVNFDSCCGSYEQCLQQCGVSKSYCDQQFYGCMWSSCSDMYRVRPGDRIICRNTATCYASYLTNNLTCSTYSYIQQQACTCEPTGNGIPVVETSSSASTELGSGASSSQGVVASSSPQLTVSASSAVVASASTAASLSLTASIAPLGVSPAASSLASPSPSPVAKKREVDVRQVVTNDTSSAVSSSASSSVSSSESSIASNDNNANNDNGSTLNNVYRSRVVPGWDVLSSNGQCEAGNVANINFINVMSDQEMDEINFWGTNA